MTDLAIISPENHDRAKFIGGADIAAILGISPWMTPLDLWERKTKPRVEGQAKAVFKRGQRWEAVVGEMLTEALVARDLHLQFVGANKRYVDPVIPFFASEIDWELRLPEDGEILNCELKTVHPFRAREWGESGTDELPIHYLAQVQWGLGVTGRDRGYLAALFGADELRIYPVERDDETIVAMRDRARGFWTDHVLAGIPPDPVTLEDLSKLFDKDNPEAKPLLADEELAQQVLRMRAINAEVKAREAEAEALEFSIKRALRDCTSIVMPNGKEAVTWRQRSGSWLDETALKEAHPKIHKDFLRKWEKRVFTLKAFDTKGL